MGMRDEDLDKGQSESRGMGGYGLPFVVGSLLEMMLSCCYSSSGSSCTK